MILRIVGWGVVLFGVPAVVSATDFSSSNFNVRDPIIHIASSTEMVSSSFRLTGSIGQIAIGTSSSATFEVRSGFLYFPTATMPTLSGTAGDGQASLSWTTSNGFLGWSVSGYNVGQSTVSGGPYTYTSVGNVTSSTRTGLTNGTTYYFIVRPEDTFGNSLATSSEIVVTPIAGSAAPSPSPSSSPGGGIIMTLLEAFGLPVPPAFPSPTMSALADLNFDGVVNLSDLSIFLFNPRGADGKINLAESLSIFLNQWTEPLISFRPDEGDFYSAEGQPSESNSGLAFVGRPSGEQNAYQSPAISVAKPVRLVPFLMPIGVVVIILSLLVLVTRFNHIFHFWKR